MEKDLYFRANLIEENLIEVYVVKSYNDQGLKNFYLYEDGKFIQELHIANATSNSKAFVYLLDDLPPLKIGKEYFLMDERNFMINVNISLLNRLDKYIQSYQYEGKLGALYQKEETTFIVFAPSATQGFVLIYDKFDQNKLINTIMMEKDEKNGIFKGICHQDLAGFYYTYLVKINGNYQEALDPYARSVSSLSLKGAIIDESQVDLPLNNQDLTPLASITDAIIYELDIRDMTSDPTCDIVAKGKYLGLIEKGIKTKKHHPVGYDYIKELGVTHIQVMPVYDFITINDERSQEQYNWGYDPINYNALEGSYASDSQNPYTRILEFKKMVSIFHHDNIRVVMDVVYNHVFNAETSSFETLCPNYYFKYRDNKKANGSLCGNEFESRHFMGRKFIVDSCLYYVKEFGIDGFRFDLMGLLDVTTLNEIYEKCHAINPSFIMYGEGWEMDTPLEPATRGSMNNASKMPHIGFFNDRFRDVVKGKTSFYEEYVRGYLTGDINYRDGFKHCLASCILPLAFPPLFDTPAQSINYVECHDNNTLYDKLKTCCYDDSEEEIFKRLKLINGINVLSLGVPFIHMGQEIGLSKNNLHNSYNAGDEINQFHYQILDERYSLYQYMKDVISLKKECAFFRLKSKEVIMKSILYVDEPGGGISVHFVSQEVIKPYRDVICLINPTKNVMPYHLDDYYQIILNENGRLRTPFYGQNLMVNGLALVICVKK